MPRDKTEPEAGQIWSDDDPRYAGENKRIVLMEKTTKGKSPAFLIRGYVNSAITGVRRLTTVKNLQRWYTFTNETVTITEEDR